MANKRKKMTATHGGRPGGKVQKAVRLTIELLRRGGFEIAEGGHGPGSFVYPNPGDDRYIQVVYVPAGMMFSQNAAGEWGMRPDAPGDWRPHPTIADAWVLHDTNGQPMDVPNAIAAHLSTASEGRFIAGWADPASMSEPTEPMQ